MILMNGDTTVLHFDFDEYVIQVLNNDFLPYSLKDFVQSIKPGDSLKEMAENARYMDALKDFLSGRVLETSKSNAKEILNSAGLPGASRNTERIKICIACRGLSMTDNFWLKEDDEQLTFSDVNLRNKYMYGAAFEISMLGHVLPASKEILKPDISTHGIFAKTWNRAETGIELWKTDLTVGNINTRAEVRVSEILDAANVPHVRYQGRERDGLYLAACPCITDDNVSMISGQELKDWCEHTKKDFITFVESINKQRFAQMAVVDYLLSNTDRHLENFGFLVDNRTNTIMDMAPLYDHNQALIADVQGKDISDLMYEPTGLSLKDSANKYFADAGIEIDWEMCQSMGLFKFDGVELSIMEKYKGFQL